MKRESVSRKDLSTKSREASHEQVIEKQIRSVGFPGLKGLRAQGVLQQRSRRCLEVMTPRTNIITAGGKNNQDALKR